jgi:hypothetical protein
MLATALTGQNITVGNLTPSGNLIQNLGSPTNQFKDLYLSNSTIFLGSLQLKDTGGALTVTASGGGAAVNFARSTDKLSTFAATSSSELAGVISDETGSGALVFGTSPAITTSLTTGSSSFDLINTTATTVNFAKAATALSMGAATGTTTVNNNLTVTGNLTVSGTTTTVSSSTLEVTDKNITVAKGAADSSAADGAGITVDGASASLNYSHTGTKWVSNKPFNISDETASTSTSTGALIVAGGVGVTGNIVASGQVTAADINSSSDKRLKKNIKTVTSALDTVNALRGVTFDWKEGNGKAIGLIAQEVQEVLPEIVSTDDNGYLGIRYTNVVGVLVEAIKELKADFEAYKKTHP